VVCSSNESCEVCHLTSRVLRCASPASKDLQYNLSVSVVDLRSNVVPYNYRDIMSSPSFLSVSPLAGPTTGGTLVRLVGKNFKDRGVVRMTSSFASYVCATPPMGSEGNASGPFYGKDGKLIQVEDGIKSTCFCLSHPLFDILCCLGSV
jgi:hypothetical protein